MTELAIIPNPPEIGRIPDRTEVAIQRLGDWANSARAAHEIATTLVQTSFVPEQFRGKPGEATAAILAGMEVGLNPMAALRSFDIIQGTAAPRAITLRAVVQSQGHEMLLVESTATKCRMKGKRRGSAEWQEVTWTIDRARQLKLATKPNWVNQPQAMLLARATSELARLVASDAILGIGYAIEELEDQEPEPSRTVARSTAKRTVARKTAEAPPVGPTEPDEPPLDDPTEDEGTSVTRPQLAKIMASFNDMDITERPDRLEITRALLNQSGLVSASELSKDQASTLIDLLEQALGEPEPAEALRALAGIADTHHGYTYDTEADDGTCAVCNGPEDAPAHVA